MQLCASTHVLFVMVSLPRRLIVQLRAADFDPDINSVYQNQYSDTSWTASTVDLLHNHPDRHNKCGANASIDS